MTSSSRTGTGGPVALFNLVYDTALPGTNCPSTATALSAGRLGYREDSFGRTGYAYRNDGQVLREWRQRVGTYASGCQSATPNYDRNPDTIYSYSAGGNLTQVTYPHGRVVKYAYGTTNGLNARVADVKVASFDGTTWTDRQLVQGIVWEPFGGLRRYQFLTGATATAVNRVDMEPAANVQAAPAAATCAALTFDTSTPDATGRPRSLFVSKGNTTAGDYLKQVYTWKGELLTAQDTCFTALGQTAPHKQTYGYDAMLRLSSAGGSTLPVRTTATFGRTYNFDKRSNRANPTTNGGTESVIDGCKLQATYAASPKVDLLNSRVTDSSGTGGCNSQAMGYSRTNDVDGRVAALTSNTTWWQLGFGYASPTAFQAGLESVYQSVATPGGTYQYFYDATNHRRAKQYPSGAVVETFYDLGGRVLSVRSPNALTGATETTTDDYIWLGDRLIAQVRGRFNAALTTRLGEPGQTCTAVGEASKCGTHHVINDYLPKPILMVESATELVTGAALYDEWGNPNRVPLVAGVATSAGVATIGSASLPQGGTLQARALYARVDLGGATTALLNGAVGQGGLARGHVWSAWTSSTTTATVTTSAGWASGTGVQTEAIEYKRYSPKATPSFPVLRFPGQMYDSETELHENWNRFYDPNVGRYLQPEPLLQIPEYKVLAARTGQPVPTYAYAANNPQHWTDSDGLRIRSTTNVTYDRTTPGAPRTVFTDYSGNIEGCKKSGGRWKFDASIKSNIDVFTGGKDDARSLNDGNSCNIADHEDKHVEDYVDGMSEDSLNTEFPSEGFRSRAACEAAQHSLKMNITPYINYLTSYSQSLRDAFEWAR